VGEVPRSLEDVYQPLVANIWIDYPSSDKEVKVKEIINQTIKLLINLNIVRQNLEEVNQQISQPPRNWRIVQ
jgi:hypothetical protein